MAWSSLFCMWISNCPRIIYWKITLFPLNYHHTFSTIQLSIYLWVYILFHYLSTLMPIIWYLYYCSFIIMQILGSVTPGILFFFLKFVLAILGPLHFIKVFYKGEFPHQGCPDSESSSLSVQGIFSNCIKNRWNYDLDWVGYDFLKSQRHKLGGKNLINLAVEVIFSQNRDRFSRVI